MENKSSLIQKFSLAFKLNSTKMNAGTGTVFMKTATLTFFLGQKEKHYMALELEILGKWEPVGSTIRAMLVPLSKIPSLHWGYQCLKLSFAYCLVSGILRMPLSIKGCSSPLASSHTSESEDSKNAVSTLWLHSHSQNAISENISLYEWLNALDLKDLKGVGILQPVTLGPHCALPFKSYLPQSGSQSRAVQDQFSNGPAGVEIFKDVFLIWFFWFRLCCKSRYGSM